MNYIGSVGDGYKWLFRLDDWIKGSLYRNKIAIIVIFVHLQKEVGSE